MKSASWLAPAMLCLAMIGPGALAGPPPAAPTAPTVPMAPRAPVANSPTDTPIAKQASLKTCNKTADGKGLTGKDRAAFVKDCLAGNTPPPQDD